MGYDNIISRGDAAAGMPADAYRKGKKTSTKGTPAKGTQKVETNTFRSQAKKK